MSTFTLKPLAPPYSYKFPFEKHFDPLEWHRWMSNNWCLPAAVITVYMVLVGVHTYRNKNSSSSSSQSKSVCLPLFLWNLTVSLFCAVGAWRTFPELKYSMQYFGFHHTVCDAAYMVKDPVSGFWTLARIISKGVVLGDTVFLIVRGRPVALLHGFYHASVFAAGWLLYAQKMAAVRWFVFLDFNVSALLYGYLAIRSLRISLPRAITFGVTTTQILQMIPGTYFSLYSYLCWFYEESCDVTGLSAHLSLILYLCYLVLFLEFFYSAYIEQGKEYIKKEKIQ